MHLTTITRPMPTKLTRIDSRTYAYVPVPATRQVPVTRVPARPMPTRFLPAESPFLDILSIVATSDRPPVDYLSRVHGIGADELRFLSRAGLIVVSEDRVYVTDSGLSELS